MARTMARRAARVPPASRRHDRPPRRDRPATAPDQATRQRVFDAATDLFAQHGFKRVTVRQIAAAAQANVAAVNYHFGDKAGLYTAIVDSAIAAMQETGTLARQAADGQPPREQLAAFIRVFVTRMAGSGRLPWIHRLMVHEMDDPTDALERVVNEVLEPRLGYLAGIVAALTGLDAGDPRVLRAAASIQGQVLMFVRPLPAKTPRAWKILIDDAEGAIAHITAFSLGGLEAIARDSR